MLKWLIQLLEFLDGVHDYTQISGFTRALWIKRAAMSSEYARQRRYCQASWVTAAERWPWLIRWKEPLIKHLIESNTAPLLLAARHLCPAPLFLLICHPLWLAKLFPFNLLNLFSSCRANPLSPWTPQSLLFLFVHPISGEWPGKDTLLTIQSGSTIQMGSMSLYVLQHKKKRL